MIAPGSAADLYRRSIVIDGLGGPGGSELDPGESLTPRMVADARASGVTACNLTIGSVGGRPPLEAFEAIVRDLARWQREVEAHPEVLAIVKNAEALRAAKRTGRVGLVFGLQDGVAFEDDPTRLDVLAQLGVRIVQPTYNRRNLLGDGCLEPDDAGLSRAGREAVERMNGLRVLIDLSHCGRRTAREAATASARPPAFTHVGCAAIHDHPRNRTDEELRMLADRGGVVGIYWMPYLRPAGQPMAEDVVRHLEHALRVAGEDHVGIGTDLALSPFESTPALLERHREITAERIRSGIAAPGEAEDVYLYIPDLNTPRRLETLAERLLERGHSAGRVEKVLGGNFERLLAEAWG